MTRSAGRVFAVAFLVLLVAGHFAYQDWYAKPMSSVTDEQSRLLRALEDSRDESRALLRTISEIESREVYSLGNSADRVTLNLRRLLSAIAAQSGVSEPKIDTRLRGAVVNPASNERLDEFREGRSRRPIASFSLVEADVSAVLSVAQAIEFADRLRAQPLLWRVTQWRMQAAQDGRMGLRATVEAAWVRGDSRALLEVPSEPSLRSLEADEVVRISQAFTKYVEPPPPEPEVVAVEQPSAKPSPVAPPPAPPPLSLWRLTAVTETMSGGEMWISHTQSGQRMVLDTGQAVHSLIFVKTIGSDALVRVRDELRVIRLGELLSASEPAASIE